jgi:uncharacterized protein RhaS with RHS repeats
MERDLQYHHQPNCGHRGRGINGVRHDIYHQQGIIAIHTDRRHAPVAATDEQGKVIWQAEYDAWGSAITPSPFKGEGWGEGQVSPINPINHQTNQSNQNTFNIALRLPGQWQDQATGLYYNYQRDYNP